MGEIRFVQIIRFVQRAYFALDRRACLSRVDRLALLYQLADDIFGIAFGKDVIVPRSVFFKQKLTQGPNPQSLQGDFVFGDSAR